MTQQQAAARRKRYDDTSCPHKATISASGKLSCGGQELGLAQYQQLCGGASQALPLSCIYMECLDMCLKVGHVACSWMALSCAVDSLPVQWTRCQCSADWLPSSAWRRAPCCDQLLPWFWIIVAWQALPQACLASHRSVLCIISMRATQ